jgi:type II secretory pathway component PulK
MQVSKRESGLALLIVMFIVALASMLVVNLTYSTYLGSRISVTAEKSVQAEYLLKSAVNYAMVLIKEDIIPGDSAKDIWGKYAMGIPLQKDELVNYTLPNIPITLEIRPEGAKLNIPRLSSVSLGGQPDIKVRGVFERLFSNIQVGFEFDGEPFIAPDGQEFKFTSKDLIANLIDYMDKDEDPYTDTGYQGVEGPNSLFPNRPIARIGELNGVPGFTASRIKKLLPYVTTLSKQNVNINLASKTLLTSLDPDLTPDIADKMIAFRKSDDGPFKQASDLQDLLNDATLFGNLQGLVDYESNRYQVLAKVEYSTSIFYIRVDLQKNGKKQLPSIKTLELF